jgi:hypothetical protein
MADIAPIPFINFGASQAQQGQATASANLQNQQAQGLQMQNQITRASMPMVMQAMNEASADQSGTTPGNPNAAAPKTINGQSASDDQSGTGYGYDGANIETMFRNQNYVQPWTPQEQQQLVKWTGLAGLPGMAGDIAKARLAALQTQRQARIDNTTTANQLAMGNMYDSWGAASTADDPLMALAAVPGGKGVASQIAMRYGNDRDGAEEEAKAFLEHGAAVAHLYSGRKTHDVNGQLVDDATDQNVIGQHQVYRGSTAEQLGNDRKWAAEDMPITFSDGSTGKRARYLVPVNQGGLGGITPDQYALQQDQARRKLPTALQGNDPGGPPVNTSPPPANPDDAKTPATNAQLQSLRGKPQSAGGPAPNTALAIPPAHPMARTTQAQSAAAANPTVPPPAPGKRPFVAGAEPSMTPTDGVLDLAASNPNPLPKGAPKIGPAPPAQDIANWTAYNQKARDQDASAGQNVGAATTAIQIARNAQAALKNDAATGGTASARQAIATALNNPAALKFILGDATSSAILRKMLGNQSFTQIESDANGNQMRLGANTIKVAMTQLSASPEMTPQAIQALTGQIIKNANYEKQKWGADYAAYSRSGGDVIKYDGQYDTKYPNTTHIDTAAGPQANAPPVRVTSPDQAQSLPSGTVFITPDGRQMVKR